MAERVVDRAERPDSLSRQDPIGYRAPVTETPTQPDRSEPDRSESGRFSPRRLTVAALVGLGSHALVGVIAFVATRFFTPSPGGGFEDLAALAYVLFLGEIAVGLGCLVVAVVLYVKGRRDAGLGLLGGWLLGLIVGCVLLQR